MDYESHEFSVAIRRLSKRLDSLKNQGLRIAVLGAGDHTARIAEKLDFAAHVSCLYDTVLPEAKTFVGRLPVLPLENLDYEQTDAFVLCTYFQQENLREKLLNLGVPAGHIHDMYTPADRVLQFKRVAYNPLTDPVLPPCPGTVPGPGLDNSYFKPRFINRVLLVHPPFALANYRHKKTMPMGLLSLGGYLRQCFPDIQVEVVDAHIRNQDPAQVIQIVRNGQYDLVCLSAWTSQAPCAYAIADAVRSEGHSGVVIGGVHATLCPEDAIEHADFIIAGEGELPFAGLVDALRNGDDPSSVTGVATRPGQDPGRQVLKDLDVLPYPAWELLPDWRLYDFPLHVVGGYRFPIMGSRGCPFACTFCSSPLMWQRKVRWNSPEYVAGQMLDAYRRYGVNQFHFWDDNLLLKPGHMEALCELLLDSGVSFTWLGLSRASDINRRKNILGLMKRAGCIGMEIGIESFTQQSADLTSKGEKIEAMIQAAENLISADLAPLYTHMLFTPGEDLFSYPAKKKFLDRINSHVPAHLRSDGGLGQLTTPHKATQFAEQAPSLGMVFSRENRHYVHHRVNFIPNSLLDDIPRRLTATPGSPYPYLNLIVGFVHDWTLSDMEDYVLVHNFLWETMDGIKPIRELGTIVSHSYPHLSLERAIIYTALVMTGLAKDNRIAGVCYESKEINENTVGQRTVA